MIPTIMRANGKIGRFLLLGFEEPDFCYIPLAKELFSLVITTYLASNLGADIIPNFILAFES